MSGAMANPGGRGKSLPGTPEYEWEKFEFPARHIVDHDSGDSPGPDGTRWEAHYRALAPAGENAEAKGRLSRPRAIKEIENDASRSNALTQLHKNYVLYVKNRAGVSLPQSAEESLRTLFAALLEREFSGQWDTTRAPDLPFENEPGLTIHRDVPYGNIDPGLQTMDVYLADSDKPAPVMVEFHGGGWRRGSKRQLHTYKGDLIRRIFQSGISLVAADYRLSPKHRFPAQMEDAARVIQFIRHKAGEWNIDPGRVAAMGGSAGGHLSAWIALNDDQVDPASADPVARESSRLSCFIDRWGPVDLTRYDPVELKKMGPGGADMANAICAPFGVHYEEFKSPEAQKRIEAASPLFQLTPDDPPGFLMFAAEDETFDFHNHPPVPKRINDAHSHWQGVLLADAMREIGVECVPYIGPRVSKNHEEDVQAILDFLHKHLIGG
jgi:acetyl esterase